MDVAAIVQGSIAGVLTGAGVIVFLSKIVFRKLNDIDDHAIKLVDQAARIEEHTRILAALNGNIGRFADNMRQVGADVSYLKGKFDLHEEWERAWRAETTGPRASGRRT